FWRSARMSLSQKTIRGLPTIVICYRYTKCILNVCDTNVSRGLRAVTNSEERWKEIGQRVANYRRHLSITQEEMGKRYNCSKAVWCHYELGKRSFNIEVGLLFSEREQLDLNAIYKGIYKTSRERLMSRHPSETWRPDTLEDVLTEAVQAKNKK